MLLLLWPYMSTPHAKYNVVAIYPPCIEHCLHTFTFYTSIHPQHIASELWIFIC